MKILYVNSPECDYMQDLLYSGLVKTLGASNVVDCPLNPRYHWVKKKYPRNLGFNAGLGFLARPFQPLDFKSFQAVIVGACKHKAMESYLQILPKIPASVPVILIDGGDRPELGGDMIRTESQLTLERVEKHRPFDLIFKREYFSEENPPSRVVPLPFCMNLDRMPAPKTAEKKYNVSFWAVESHPIRTKALTLLENAFDCRDNGTIRDQKFHKYSRKGSFYLEELSRCKIVLNFRGAGWDTLRYWEVPAMETFLITEKPQIHIPNDFEHKKHVVHCREDLSDLLDICQHYLNNETEREAIAKAGHEHMLKYHQDIHRAQAVIERIKKGGA